MTLLLSSEQSRIAQGKGFTRPNFQPSKISKKLRRAGKNLGGFTLIELLVVIAIIGVLASVILGALNTARQKGQIAKAKSELRNVRSAVALLESDTGKWPNGCPPGTVANPEVDLSTAQAGVRDVPTVQDNGGGCEWTAADIAGWKGPYMKTEIDPWGHAYEFDPDYSAYENRDGSNNAQNNCPGNPNEPDSVVVVSYGPNGGTRNKYDCDDIFLKMN